MNRVLLLLGIFGFVCCFAGVAAEKVAEGAYPDITVDHAGDFHLAYAREEFLYYQKYDREAKTWGGEEAVGVPVGKVHRSDPEIVMNPNFGSPQVIVGKHMAWKGKKKWAPWPLNVVRDTALAIDSKGTVFICRRGGFHGGYMGVLRMQNTDSRFFPTADPDIAAGFEAGRNDHVYGDIAVSAVDDSVHVVYRHGTPTHCAYRYSTDMGKTWKGGGITDDDREAPAIAIARDGTVYVVTGRGFLYKKIGEPSEWDNLGQAVEAGRRDRPQIWVDKAGTVYISQFGGDYNIYKKGKWSGVKTIASAKSQPVGFMRIITRDKTPYAVWEEGEEVNNDEVAGTSNILFGELP
ncbi:hypothetical protein GF373_02855 [bacterium]|nr:hypothetical protein [bacterium]